jgi:hypothetical protein
MESSQIDRKKSMTIGQLLIYCSLSFLVSTSTSAEVLMRLSDDMLQAQEKSTPKQAATDNRRITYRVICGPESQDLPDCDKGVEDNFNEPVPIGQIANTESQSSLPAKTEVANNIKPSATKSTGAKAKKKTNKPHKKAK